MKFSQREYRDFPIIDLKGKLTAGPEAEEFREIFRSLVQQGKTHVILDLQNVEWISSTGIGIMIRGYKTLREAGGDLVMIGLTERTLQVFNILRLDHIFKIFASEQEAVGALERMPKP